MACPFHEVHHGYHSSMGYRLFRLILNEVITDSDTNGQCGGLRPHIRYRQPKREPFALNQVGSLRLDFKQDMGMWFIVHISFWNFLVFYLPCF